VLDRQGFIVLERVGPLGNTDEYESVPSQR
jgi:hypothetical protein